MTRILLVSLALLPAVLSAQGTIMWASFPVEREAFMSTEADPRRYRSAGTFDGIGLLYFSPERRTIKIEGLKKISIPFLGQEPDDKYEFHHETFTLTSVIRIGDGEYAFQGTNDGPFSRMVTDRIRVTVSPSGVSGRVDEFLMEEHGQSIKGENILDGGQHLCYHGVYWS